MKIHLRYAIVLLTTTTLCQTGSSAASDDIVKKLMPVGTNAHILPLKLSSTEKTRASKELEQAQATGDGERANQIAFLLAALNSNYEKNRDHLIWALRGCSPPRHECDDAVGDFLIELYRHGHKDVLSALLKSGLSTDNASLSEGLGSFYSDLVTNHPSDFLDGIHSFSPVKQRRLCALAGSSDGGGMAPDDLRTVRKSLKVKGDDVAQLCLREIERANKR